MNAYSTRIKLSRLSLRTGGGDDVITLGNDITRLTVNGGGGFDTLVDNGLVGDDSPSYRSIEALFFD